MYVKVKTIFDRIIDIAMWSTMPIGITDILKIVRCSEFVIYGIYRRITLKGG